MTKRGVRRWVTPFIVAAGALSMGGCAAPVIGAVTLSQLTTAAGVASSIMSGRDLTEHVVSAVVGEDCRFLEAIVRGRPICVPYGSPEAEDSFQGVIVALADDDADATGENVQVAGLDADAIALGFVPITPDISNTSAAMQAVERDISDPRRGDMRRVSFGMISATYGASHSMDDLLAQQRANERDDFAAPASDRQAKAGETGKARVILASAAPTPLPAKRSDGKVIVPDMRGTSADTPEEIAARAVMDPIADDHLSE